MHSKKTRKSENIVNIFFNFDINEYPSVQTAFSPTNKPMNYPIQADVMPFLKNIIASCLPFSAAQSVGLRCETSLTSLVVPYNPEEIVTDLTQLICRIVTFTPQNQNVVVRLDLVNLAKQYFIKIEIENSGVNLSRIGEIVARLKNPCVVHAEYDNKTVYELQWHLKRPVGLEAPTALSTEHPPDNVRHFYDAVRKRMSQAFNRKETLYEILLKTNPQDAILLKKVDALIQSHLDDENFDANALAKALAMSRMHLHRKLKPVVNKTPADYIRCKRMEHAKHLIETTDLTMGEVCFKIGFQSQSHFTRAFTNHFGVRPTAYKK